MKILISFLLSVPFFVQGQENHDPSRPQLRSLTQTGRMVTLEAVPKDKTFTFSLLGKPAAKLDLSKAQVEVVLISLNERRPLKLTKSSESRYQTEVLPEPGPHKMEVKVKVGKDQETFQVETQQP